MKKFGGIDGLRGWLAWAVVASHVILFTGTAAVVPRAYRITQFLADNAVLLFVIISGFVITHLLISRRERYALYIKRRALRLYPVYIVALAVGIIGTYLAFNTFLAQPWGPLSPPIARMASQRAELVGGHLIAHLIAHLTLLHGAIPNNVLFESQYMFLAPAWSLSLEWQFYLVAPFVIAAALDRRWRWALGAMALAFFELYIHGRLGSFVLPSFLPGAVWYFATGIVSRIAMQPRRRGWVAAGCMLVVFVAWRGVGAALPMFIWAIFVALMLASGGPARRIFAALFESRIARWFGDHSYPTYLIHVPLVQIGTWVAVTQMHLSPLRTLAGVAPVTVVLVAGAAMLLRRYIEEPGMALGKRLSQPSSAPPEHPDVTFKTQRPAS
ncbi:acyltransferase family protein [Paraburkholderia elongata]|nr:acyltransferase [Paraburkholderia elongata]